MVTPSSETREAQLEALAIKLFEINAFKFGDFKMKVGINSPVYFDLRVIVSFPTVMRTVAELLASYIETQALHSKHICGVPYTALPLATLISVQQDTPMLVRRKEAKSYGTKKLIEGLYSAGDTCLIVEDVVTSGSSILDTVRDLKSEGIVVTDAVVVVNREQGGEANIANNGVRMHSLFTLSFLMNTLLKAGKVQRETVDAVAKYIQTCQIKSDGSPVNVKPVVNEFVRTNIPFEQRAELAKCDVGRKLFQLMQEKKSNLCLAADSTQTADILRLAEACGPHICMLKTHVDIIEDFSTEFVQQLRVLAEKYNFLLMEDSKFADIGNTVSLQYGKGMYRIADWADLVTAHSLTGRSILQGLRAGLSGIEKDHKRGVFLLGEMSATGNLIDAKYKEATNKIATEGTDLDLVAGLVCQSKECFASPGLIQLTPGVRLDESSDNLGQQYDSPEHVVLDKGADIGVVGRGILQAKCPEKAAALYRERLWDAYVQRVSGGVTA